VEDVCVQFGSDSGGVIMSFLESYRERKSTEIRELLSASGSKPILFVGSGLSIRYCNGPNWEGLLREVMLAIGKTEADFTYIIQKHGHSLADIGQELVEIVFEWAWSAGRNSFPNDFFERGVSKDVFLKQLCANIISSATRDMVTDSVLQEEVELLKAIAPHSIVTTNFDLLMEILYPDYECVFTERVIAAEMNNIGEIVKVHGSIKDPSSLVLTREDYIAYSKKRKYISAKLMTYFAEHPVFIFGYSLSDPNIKRIISDLGEAAIKSDNLFDNIYFVEWINRIDRESQLREEIAFSIDENDDPSSQVRIRAVTSTELGWIFEILKDAAPIDAVKVSLLRKLLSRFRTFVADRSISAPNEFFVKVSDATDDRADFAKVLGFGDVASTDLTHPYTLSQVAKRIGFDSWQKLNHQLNLAEPGFMELVRGKDSSLHCAISTGKSCIHKYSDEFIDQAKSKLTPPPTHPSPTA
jgi:rRNA processing protein Gar1